jgi:hypothetical protein
VRFEVFLVAAKHIALGKQMFFLIAADWFGWGDVEPMKQALSCKESLVQYD